MATLEPEKALQAFLGDLPAGDALNLRTLAHAWTSGGGRLLVGKLSIRLVAGDEPFTAATLHPGRDGPATLEICRIIIGHHGITPEVWSNWCDEYADLGHGFDRGAKFPTISVTELTPGETVRLVNGLRDLAQQVQ